MNDEELKKLIEKYYDGESTVDEERALRDYFTQVEVPDVYMTEKKVFSYYKASEHIPEPSFDFESRILKGIDASEPIKGSAFIRKRYLTMLSAAAGFLILAGSYFFLIRKGERVDTISDPVIAYSETMKVLFQVSSQLNQAAHALEPIGKINEMTTKSFEPIHKSTKTVEKSLKNLDYLQIATDLVHNPVEKNINK
jgi:hypothetical protein